MPSSSSSTASRRTISELAQLATVDGLDPALPVKAWWRSARMLHSQARIYRDEGDLETAFVYLVQAAKITIDALPSHPAYARQPADVKASIRKDAHGYLEEIGPLKLRLSSLRADDDRSTTDSTPSHSPTFPVPSTSTSVPPTGPAPTRSSRKPQASERGGLIWPVGIGEGQGQRMSVVEGGIQYVRPEDASFLDSLAKPPSIEFSAPADDRQSREGLVKLPSRSSSEGKRERKLSLSGFASRFNKPRESVEMDRSRSSSSSDRSTRPPRSRRSSIVGAKTWTPPASPASVATLASTSAKVAAAPVDGRMTASHLRQQGYATHSALELLPPARPPRTRLTVDYPSLARPASVVYAVPSSIRTVRYPPVRPPKQQIRPPATPQQARIDEVEATVASQGRTRTEGGAELRSVILPDGLVDTFVALAVPGTDRGIETCGLLLGILRNDVFRITTLLVPKQTGTADTCTTTNEEEVWEVQDKRDLLTLGWMHTHPTMTCFMSSLDLHTHAGYQMMLSEAVAIVCSPRHDPSVGFFRLTDPPGLQTIGACTRPGAFHPHPENIPIYTDANDGHLKMGTGLPFEVVDMR